MENNLRFVDKGSLLEAISQSQKEIILLGTTAFNLPWSKDGFLKDLYNKYSNGNFRIEIYAESTPLLESISLTSKLRGMDKEYPIALLMEARSNATTKLREYFLSSYAKGNTAKGVFGNFEPVEDICRNKLDAVYEEKYIFYVCKELISQNVSERELIDDIKNNLLYKYTSEMNQAFNKSELLAYCIENQDYYSLSNSNNLYKEVIQNRLKELLQEIESLKDLIQFVKTNIEIPFEEIINSKTFTIPFRLETKKVRKYCLECVLDVLVKRMKDYKLIKDYSSKEAYSERHMQLENLSLQMEYKQRLIIKTLYHPFSIQMIKIDDSYFANLDPIHHFDVNKFLYMGDVSLEENEDIYRYHLFEEYVKYFNSYCSSTYCIEETKKGNRKEVIYNYTADHVMLGQMPRDSFYGSDNYKLVMWALIFDREGRILIHKRSINAKDNQGMWDKSVGGHISLNDYDTITGASREIAEELYTCEEAEQGHSKNDGWTAINKDKIIYLGKWKESRYPNFATSLVLEPDEFYSFSFNSRLTAQPIDSMRILPDGTQIKAKCFVDLYFVITSERFDLSELKNSDYLVLFPYQIKQFAKAGLLPKEVSEKEAGAFEVTPDLQYMLDSPEWDNEITKFSLRVKEAFENC